MNSSIFFGVALAVYLLASLLYIIRLAFKQETVGLIATGATIFGLVVQTAALGLRWKESYDLGYGHVPLSNMYESMVFFGWSIVLLYLIFEWKYKMKALGAVVLPLALLIIASQRPCSNSFRRRISTVPSAPFNVTVPSSPEIVNTSPDSTPDNVMPPDHRRHSPVMVCPAVLVNVGAAAPATLE